MISAVDLAACRSLLRDGSRSFALAARLLPRSIADAATGLYAFCRVADDLIDGAGSAPARERALDGLRRRLDDVYRQQPGEHPEDRVLACLVHDHGVPRALPDALLEGFAWDAEGRRYRTLAELEAYGVRVAGTVGLMLCLLMGERRPQQLARACDLGIAMQLTNIARDVGEDARAGRLYLPLDWFEAAGLDAAGWLRAPAHGARLARMVDALLIRADELYRRGDAGIERLPRGCRPGIRAARRIYADIGRTLRRAHLDGVGRRAVVGPGRKALLLGAALRPMPQRGPLWQAPVHPGAADLVACVGLEGDVVPRSRPNGSLAQTLELFLRLDRRTRLMTGSGNR
ncbi:MAG: phytoene/squalene synthase family protein [Pseudomonadales bacterium]